MNKIFNKNTVTEIFTVASIAYLPKAAVLAKSVVSCEQRELTIFICDKMTDIDLSWIPARVVWIEDVPVPELKRLAFKYDVTEFSTAVKPFLANALLSVYEKIVFLDPDIKIFNSLHKIWDLLGDYPIVLTPHYTTPIDDPGVPYDLGMMRFGSFNLGFFGVSRAADSKKFLDWWHARCMSLCFFETQFGLSTDQKWVSIIPCFFENIHISFDLGFNVAFWNLHERVVTKKNSVLKINDKFELVFFHFSSFDEKNPRKVSKRSHPWSETGRRDLFEICDTYAAELRENDRKLSSYKYGFDYMSNGDYISPALRRAFAAVEDRIDPDLDPFDGEGQFRDFVNANHLRVSGGERYLPAGFADVSRYKRQLGVVNFFMRLLLVILGPIRFSNFSRLLVYLSSYRQNSGMWKVPASLKAVKE